MVQVISQYMHQYFRPVFLHLPILVSSRVQAVLPVSLSLLLPFTLLSDLSHKFHHPHLPDPLTLTLLLFLSPLPPHPPPLSASFASAGCHPRGL